MAERRAARAAVWLACAAVAAASDAPAPAGRLLHPPRWPRHEIVAAAQPDPGSALLARRDPHANGVNAEKEDARAREARALLFGRCTVLICLFSFTFFNGVARRSLSSAGPSLVAEGFITEDRAEKVFSLGFDAFALGKLLVLPTLLLLGAKSALLLEVAMVTASSAALCFAGNDARVQALAWVWLRIFSAMATSTALPFVGNWFPRAAYGRVFGWVFTGFQAGYLFVSVCWQKILFSERGLHWRMPFASVTAMGTVLFIASATMLRERPTAPPSSPGSTGAHVDTDRAREKPLGRWSQLLKLLAKVRTRWVFWGMVATVFAYTPIVEYSTHVTSYMKEMASNAKPTRDGFVCLASNLCESRYRGYVFSYVFALLIGSIFYDRATQLDRALFVLGLYAINILCWSLLALSEPDKVPALQKRSASAELVSGMKNFITGLWFTSTTSKKTAEVILPMSSAAKTTLASIAGATIALPSCLPFAIFALDFGKEGAAVLSAVLSAVSMFANLGFLRTFPIVRKRFGWFGVHSCLACAGCVAAVANGAVMLSDYRKFSRGYIIQSSLANETVVILHACSQPSCANMPMWRPGSRRVWTENSGQRLSRLRAHVPNRYCHNCGDAALLECKVKTAASEAALLTPFSRCSEWILDKAQLQKPTGGWAFSDPLRFPLAPEATYGDKRSYERRLERNEEEMQQRN